MMLAHCHRVRQNTGCDAPCHHALCLMSTVDRTRSSSGAVVDVIPMSSSIRSIVHPTDFSDLSTAAFAHALRIALAAKSKLHLLHLVQYDDDEALAFPHARRLLVQWGLSGEDDPPSVVASKLGIEVDNIRLKGQEPT